MREIATISFLDADSGEDALAIVRTGRARIALCLSLRENGDTEVVLSPSDCQALVEALKRARVMALTPRS
jgi:hypothetical protein